MLGRDWVAGLHLGQGGHGGASQLGSLLGMVQPGQLGTPLGRGGASQLGSVHGKVHLGQLGTLLGHGGQHGGASQPGSPLGLGQGGQHGGASQLGSALGLGYFGQLGTPLGRGHFLGHFGQQGGASPPQLGASHGRGLLQVLLCLLV